MARRPSLRWPALAAVMLVVPSCGGGDDPDAASSSGGQTASSAPAATTTTAPETRDAERQATQPQQPAAEPERQTADAGDASRRAMEDAIRRQQEALGITPDEIGTGRSEVGPSSDDAPTTRTAVTPAPDIPYQQIIANSKLSPADKQIAQERAELILEAIFQLDGEFNLTTGLGTDFEKEMQHNLNGQRFGAYRTALLARDEDSAYRILEEGIRDAKRADDLLRSIGLGELNVPMSRTQDTQVFVDLSDRNTFRMQVTDLGSGETKRFETTTTPEITPPGRDPEAAGMGR